MSRDLFSELKTLVATTVAPAFKELGFKKSNLNFNRTINDIVQCINIQKSKWNHAEEASFTLNLGFYNDRLYRILKNVTESPQFIREFNCFSWIRTGRLIYNQDYWYELNPDLTYENIREQIEKDIQSYVVPMFNELNSLHSLMELFKNDFVNRKFPLIADIDDIAVMELEFGDYERGKKIITDMYKEALIPKRLKSAIIYPDGREEVTWSEPRINGFAIENYQRIAKNYQIDL